jgi:hypothetical protein
MKIVMNEWIRQNPIITVSQVENVLLHVRVEVDGVVIYVETQYYNMVKCVIKVKMVEKYL